MSQHPSRPPTGLSLALTVTIWLATSGAARPASADGAACAPAGDRLAAIALETGEARTERAIAWTPAVAADAYRLTENRMVTGKCAASVTAFVPGMGILETGEGFAYDQNGGVKPHDPGEFFVSAVPKGSAPDRRGQFLSATRVDFRQTPDGLVTHYLGLWREGDRWTVASFSQRGGLNVGTVKPLLTSSLPLASVAYFPAPDTAAGQVALTLRQNPETTSLLAYSWRHPQWFDR